MPCVDEHFGGLPVALGDRGMEWRAPLFVAGLDDVEIVDEDLHGGAVVAPGGDV